MKNYIVTLIIACALTISVLITRQKAHAQNAESRATENPNSGAQPRGVRRCT